AGDIVDADAGAKQRVRNRVAECAFRHRSEKQYGARANGLRYTGEAIGQPTLGVAVSRARAYADSGPIHAETCEMRLSRRARVIGAIQANRFGDGESLDQACAPQEFEVIESFVARDVAPLRNFDSAG